MSAQVSILGFGTMCLLVALASTICTALITPRRTYYPLMRVIFAAQAFAYGSVGAAAFMGSAAWWPVRWTAVVPVLVSAAWSVYFVWRRNGRAEYEVVDAAGRVQPQSDEDYESTILKVTGHLRHDVLADADLADLESAMEQQRENRRWVNSLRREVDARKEARRLDDKEYPGNPLGQGAEIRDELRAIREAAAGAEQSATVGRKEAKTDHTRQGETLARIEGRFHPAPPPETKEGQ